MTDRAGSPVRFGLIGSGYMGRTYAACLTGHVPNGRLASVWGGRRASATAAEFDVEADPSFEAMLARADVDAVVITSPHSAHREQALAAGIGRREQYLTVYSGMETKPFLEPAWSRPQAREALGFAEGDFVLGTVSRLAELKGHDDLLDALGALMRDRPNLKLLWVGDGWWRERLVSRSPMLPVAFVPSPERLHCGSRFSATIPTRSRRSFRLECAAWQWSTFRYAPIPRLASHV